MRRTYEVTGTLTDERTVVLDESLPLTPTKVRVVVEPLRSGASRPYMELITEMRDRQRRRGHRPPTRDEVDSYLRAERGSWDD